MPRKKVARKKTSSKKTGARKKTARKPVRAKKKAVKKKPAKKKTAKKKAVKKKTAGKKAVKKKKTKTATRKKAAKKTAGKKKSRKVAKKSSPTRGKTAKKTKMKKVTSIKKKTASTTKKPGKRENIKPYRFKSGEDYMGPEQTEHFRQILLGWKRDLLDEVDRTVHYMRDEASNFPDPNDRATQEEEFALELRTRDRERKLIKKIDESLSDLENGDYGFCEICGVEIGVRRLEARPTATLCIDCKTLDEIKERHLG